MSEKRLHMHSQRDIYTKKKIFVLKHKFIFLGASTSMRDNLHGNTPLHWALLAKNLHAVAQLVTKFNADVEAVNLQGHSCVDLFKTHVKKVNSLIN